MSVTITFTNTGGVEATYFSANGETFVGTVGMIVWWGGGIK